MPEGPAAFSFSRVLLSGVSGAVVSCVLVWLYGRWWRESALTISESLIVGVLAGLSILVWRLAGNTQPLNTDGILAVSPNDVLCSVLTYVVLGVYAEVSRVVDRPGWGRLRAILTVASLVINIVTI